MDGIQKCMNEIVETYRLGGLSVLLQINSMQNETFELLKRFLTPLSPFRSSDRNVETWNLYMADFELLPHAKDLASPISLSESGGTNLMSSIPFCVTDENQEQFFVVSNDQRIFASERILFSVMFMATLWHVLNSGLCIHAAAVSHNNNGFLFLGESGAGKSTIATLSSELGIPVLAEDRVFILNKSNTYLLAAGPHPSTKYTKYSKLRPNLRGIFLLVKDTHNYIIPTKHSLAAKSLFASFFQNSASGYLPASAIELAFKTISCVARQVPTFELHFCKTPDFWKKIDEQFPD
jgi:hypothetical protein